MCTWHGAQLAVKVLDSIGRVSEVASLLSKPEFSHNFHAETSIFSFGRSSRRESQFFPPHEYRGREWKNDETIMFDGTTLCTG